MKVLIVSADRTDSRGVPCNLGDAMLTDAMLACATSLGHQASAIDFGDATRDPDQGYPRQRSGRSLSLARTIRESDLLIIGGGTLLQDAAVHSFSGLPRLVATTSNMARVTKTPCAFFGVGVADIHRAPARWLLRSGLSGRPVYVRNAESLERVHTLGATEARVSGDAIHLLSPDSLPTHTAHSHGTALLCLAYGDGNLATEQALSALQARLARISLLQMDQRPAVGDGSDLPSHIVAKFGLSPRLRSAKQTLHDIATSSLLISSRLHALYLAGLVGTPAIALSGRPKVEEYAREVGLPLVSSLQEAAHSVELAATPPLTWLQAQHTSATAAFQEVLEFRGRSSPHALEL